MDPTARFTTLVQGPEPAIPLDQLALLVAAHADHGLDIGRSIDRLDEIADRCTDRSFGGLTHHLFAEEGFGGNRDDYYDPRNSFLNDVIERRLGIPITLGIVAIEIGRRIGVPVVGIGMPGHFLVRDALSRERYADPFEGVLLDTDGCRDLFVRTQNRAEFDDSWLAPVGTRAIVARLLANLKGIYLSRRDRSSLAWVLELRAEVPGVPLEERRELASALAADGKFMQAASVLDRLAELAKDADNQELVEESTRGATRLRARLN
jgi:regulator of sirC expression with transglutaminase-like and TPR domain